MNHLKHVTGASAIALLLALGNPAAAANANGWDTDGKAGINKQEFSAGFPDNAGGWDNDGTVGLSESEFHKGLFSAYDENKNGLIERSELDRGIVDSAEFSAWDGNKDGALSEIELTENVGLYDDWDADRNGLLTNDEFEGGVYGAYDGDSSGSIDEPELTDLNDDIGDGGFWDV